MNEFATWIEKNGGVNKLTQETILLMETAFNAGKVSNFIGWVDITSECIFFPEADLPDGYLIRIKFDNENIGFAVPNKIGLISGMEGKYTIEFDKNMERFKIFKISS